MRHRTHSSSALRGTVVLAATGGLLALSVPAALATAEAAPPHEVTVTGTASGVKLSSATVTGSTVTFTASTTVPSTAQGGGSALIMFRLQNGATLDEVFADFQEEFGKNGAKGTRDLTHDAVFTGLADPTVGRSIVLSEKLVPGTYYIVDGNASGKPKPVTLTVKKGSEDQGVGKANVTVKATSSDRFVTSATWAKQGVLGFENVSDTLHFMDLVPVKAGTTDKQIQAYFDSGSNKPPAFLRKGREFDLEVQSPGGIAKAKYDLPAGSYVLLCFISDKQTGMPHALMGMHKVVTLS